MLQALALGLAATMVGAFDDFPLGIFTSPLTAFSRRSNPASSLR
jgi:hypothetical protein